MQPVMRKLGIVLQPLTVLLTVALLVLIVIDGYTYEWGNEASTSFGSNISPGMRLSVCTPWKINECSQLWNNMNIYHKIALCLLLSLIPLTAIMVLVSSLAVFTRVMREQTSISILILISWMVFFALVTSVILRISNYTGVCTSADYLSYSYHNNWQIYITLSSLIVSFVITQIFAFGGYFRPMITMLTFEGHYQRYDYPRVSNLEKNMVSVKELDNF